MIIWCLGQLNFFHLKIIIPAMHDSSLAKRNTEISTINCNVLPCICISTPFPDWAFLVHLFSGIFVHMEAKVGISVHTHF